MISAEGYLLIGYHNIEARFALRLAADLRNEGVNLWLDRLDIQLSDDWRLTQESALSDCSALLALLSPDYVASAYGKYELALIQQLQRPLIPVLLRPVAAADWVKGVGASNPVDLTDSHDPARYQEALSEIIERVTRLKTVSVTRLLNPERRYLTSLQASIESQRHRLEFVRLSHQSSQSDASPFRPAPNVEPNWGLNGPYILQDAPLAQARYLHSLKSTLDDFPRLILAGAAGAGKSTTLARLASDMIRAYRANQRSTPLPLIVNLAEWHPSKSLPEFLRSQWTLKSDVLDGLAKGAIALFLDGLDEMGADCEARIVQLRDWLHSKTAPQRVLVACRADSYDDSHFLGLPVVRIEAMTDSRLQEMLRLYLDETQSQAVITRFASSDTLLRNPLIVHLVAHILLHSPSAELPDTPARIALRYLALVWEREQLLHNPDWIPFDDLLARLAMVAFDMLQRGTSSSVDTAYAMQHLGNERLLNALCSTGIFEMRGNTVRFMHLLWQETLAAHQLQHESLHDYLTHPGLSANGQRRARHTDGAMIALNGLIPESDALLSEIADVDPYLAVLCLMSGNPVTSLTRRLVLLRLLYRAMQGDEASRAAAVQALEQLSAGDPLPPLLELMRDGNWEERQRATEFLRGTPALISADLLDVLRGWRFDLDEHVAVALRHAGDEALPVLLNLLNDADWTKRRGAAWALGELVDKAAVPALILAAQDDEVAVRREAVTALRRVQDAAAVPQLLAALRDGDTAVRKAAAYALAGLGTSAVPGLLRMMHDANPDARRIAIGVLGRVGDASAVPPLVAALADTNPDIRGMAIVALGQIAAPESVQTLQDHLTDSSKPRWANKTISDMTIQALEQVKTEEAMHIVDIWRLSQRTGAAAGKTAAQAKETLQAVSVRSPDKPASGLTEWQRAARHKDPHIRQRAIEKLGESGDPAVVPTLLIAARDDENVVRWAALRAFEHFAPTTEIIQTLIRALYDSDYSVSDTSAANLARIGQPALASLLQVARDTRHVDARGLAIEALGRIGDMAAAEVISAALNDERKPRWEDRPVSAIAAEALSALKRPPSANGYDIPAGDAEPFILRPDMDGEVSTLDTRIDELMRLLDALRDDDWQTRQQAAKALLRYARTMRGVHAPYITERLTALLQASEDFVRLAAVESLAFIGDILAVPALVQSLSDEAWTVRILAVRALGEIGHTSALHALIQTLRSDSKEQVREVAAEMLGRFKHDMALPALVEALNDKTKFVRRAVIESLGELGSREATPWLVRALHQEDYFIRWVAAEALGKIGSPEAVDDLAGYLEDDYEPPLQDKPERRFNDVVALALEQIGTPEAQLVLANWRAAH